MTKTVCVLGAGIQGVCVALMLQKHGFKVQLIDKNSDIINRASLTYEGKIHLGFVYGMDQTLQTGYKMIKDALHFAPYLDYLLENKQNWDEIKSKPNIYLVLQDSMLLPKVIDEYFEKLNFEFCENLLNTKLHYLGVRTDSIYEKTIVPRYIESSLVQAAYKTIEVSVDQVGLKDLMKQKIFNTPSIQLFLKHEIVDIKRELGGFVVDCKQKNDQVTSFKSDIVVNCLWENRIYFDQLMGLQEEKTHSLRLKYGLVIKPDSFLKNMESITMIHGAYGNFVINPNNERAFCSWYPASLKGLIEYTSPMPKSWEEACNGFINEELLDKLKQDNFLGFKKYIPDLKEFDLIKATAGVILAEGTKDISDRDSTYHSRAENPINALNGYYSVSTSKFTSAPRNTLILEKELFPEENSFLFQT